MVCVGVSKLDDEDDEHIDVNSLVRTLSFDLLYFRLSDCWLRLSKYILLLEVASNNVVVTTPSSPISSISSSFAHWPRSLVLRFFRMPF